MRGFGTMQHIAKHIRLHMKKWRRNMNLYFEKENTVIIILTGIAGIED